MKFFNYVMISVGLALIMEWAGFNVSGTLLSSLGLNSDVIGIKSFYIYTTFTVITFVAGIVIGFLTKAKSENWVVLPMIVWGTTNFIIVFIGIAGYASAHLSGWVAKIVYFIMGMLAVGFVVSAYEHWRGTD